MLPGINWDVTSSLRLLGKRLRVGGEASAEEGLEESLEAHEKKFT